MDIMIYLLLKIIRFIAKTDKQPPPKKNNKKPNQKQTDT